MVPYLNMVPMTKAAFMSQKAQILYQMLVAGRLYKVEILRKNRGVLLLSKTVPFSQNAHTSTPTIKTMFA